MSALIINEQLRRTDLTEEKVHLVSFFRLANAQREPIFECGSSAGRGPDSDFEGQWIEARSGWLSLM